MVREAAWDAEELALSLCSTTSSYSVKLIQDGKAVCTVQWGLCKYMHIDSPNCAQRPRGSLLICILGTKAQASGLQPATRRGQEGISPSVFWEVFVFFLKKSLSSEASVIVMAGEETLSGEDQGSEGSPSILSRKGVAGWFLLTCSGSN